MASVRVGVEVVGRWRRRGGANPLASAPLLISLRVRVCGGAVGTVNVGSHAPACLTFYMALREGGPLPQTADAPDQGASQIGKPIRRSLRGDHFPNTSQF
jgi:hypothetical protein